MKNQLFPLSTLVATSLLGLSLSGCLSQNLPRAPRYFLPELAPRPTTLLDEERTRPLHLDRVTAAPHLRERLVWRVSEVEVGLDDINRWAVRPAEWVTTTLQESLFEQQPFYAHRPRFPELNVHIQALEARLKQQDAYVVLVATLRVDREHAVCKRFVERTELPLRGGAEPSAQEVTRLVKTLGSTLQSACDATAAWAEEQTRGSDQR